MMIMATFAQWLAEQEGRPEDDLTGQLARLWKAAEGDRPRVSSPTGMQRWLLATQVEGGDEMIKTAVAEYHAKRGDLRVIGADESRITVMLEDIVRRLDWIEHVLRLAFDLPEDAMPVTGFEVQQTGTSDGQPAAVQYADPATGETVVQQLPMTSAGEAAAAEARAIRERAMAGRPEGWLPGPGELVGRATPAGMALAAQQPPATSALGWQQLWETADFTADEDVAR